MDLPCSFGKTETNILCFTCMKDVFQGFSVPGAVGCDLKYTDGITILY